MVAARWEADAGELLVLDEGSALWERLYERIAQHFGRVEVRARLKRYLAGLLARMDRKNGWQIAETIGEDGPQGVQRLLNSAVWDADKVRDELRAYVVEHLSDADSGVLIVDESGFPKKGDASCGVAPQYCGTIGSTTNCQVGVFLGYASRHGMAFIDRALYLPRAWADNTARREAAGVPKAIRFTTKPALAKQLLARAFTAHVPARWVVADSFYGRAHHFRSWLEGEGQSYLVAILPSQVVEYAGQRQRAQALAAQFPDEAWVRRSAGEGSQGPRVHDWAVIPLSEACAAGKRRWLVVRRSLDESDDRAYFRAHGSAATTAEELVRVAGMRWTIEEGFAQAKGEVGLDQYEVRRWEAWHRFVTLGLLVHAYLATVGSRAGQAAVEPRPEAVQKGELVPARRSSR
jgi:SRSO17 transposase